MTELLLGIDIGTASSKAVLVTLDGRIIASASVAHAMSLPRPGWAEVDAESVWWADVVSLCRELMPQAGGRTIAGMCVSGVGPCLLMCDAENRPLRPAILYGIDMRATAEIAELTERYGADEIVTRGGTPLSTQAVGPKMLWVRRHEPDVWARSSRWHNSNSFIVARLTGEYVLDHHTASQCDPLYDINAMGWWQEWVDDIAPGLEMPRLAWPSEVIGTVTAQAAEETGLPLGTRVSAGTVDAWAEAYSAGVRNPGDLMLMYGSTMFFVQVLPELRTSPLLWTTAGVEPFTHTFAAGMATSGSLTAWVQELTGGIPFEELVQEAAATPPGADGLLLLPYFAGERTPVFDPQARGVIAGLSLRHGRGHLYRAVYEGIAFGIRQILELLDEAGGGPATRILAVGGGTEGGLWTQIVSDVTGLQQLVPEQTIGACYGDALLAGIGTGRVPPATDWSRIAVTITPNPVTREVYDTLYQAYTDLYPATREAVHLLADLQESQANSHS
jgi:xylulokinase